MHWSFVKSHLSAAGFPLFFGSISTIQTKGKPRGSQEMLFPCWIMFMSTLFLSLPPYSVYTSHLTYWIHDWRCLYTATICPFWWLNWRCLDVVCWQEITSFFTCGIWFVINQICLTLTKFIEEYKTTILSICTKKIYFTVNSMKQTWCSRCCYIVIWTLSKLDMFDIVQTKCDLQKNRKLD